MIKLIADGSCDINSEIGGVIMLGLKAHEKDNVATIFKETKAGEDIQINDPKGNALVLKANDDIPYGHKIALIDIEKGEVIIKYGEVLGIVTESIKKGDYVHVHNLESGRARGDLS